MLTNNYPIVLLYHQISDSANSLINQFNITIHPRVFNLHMKTIKSYFSPIGIKEFEQALKNNKDIRKRILITFDDGYKSAIKNSCEILSQSALDSVWFVNGLFCDNTKVFWLSKIMWLYDEGLWNEFVRKANARFPGILSPKLKYGKINFNPEIKDNYSRALEYFTDEFVFHYGLHEQTVAKKADLFASGNDILELSRFAHIGIHTDSHPNVRNISLSDFRDEINTCYSKISGFAKVLAYFAFPFGQIFYHWTPAHANVAGDLGFKRIFSVANPASKLTEKTSGNVIPRFEVPCHITSASGLRKFIKNIL